MFLEAPVIPSAHVHLPTLEGCSVAAPFIAYSQDGVQENLYDREQPKYHPRDLPRIAWRWFQQTGTGVLFLKPRHEYDEIDIVAGREENRQSGN